MGYGAVKYADLKNHRTTNYKFSYDDMLAMKVGLRTRHAQARPGQARPGCTHRPGQAATVLGQLWGWVRCWPASS